MRANELPFTLTARQRLRSGGTIQDKVDQAERFAAAHRALRGDASVQFSLPPTPPDPKAPEWVRHLIDALNHFFAPIGRALAKFFALFPTGPFAQILLWTVLAVVVAGFGWMAWQRIRHGQWRWPNFRRTRLGAAVADPDGWVPDAAPAREWLAQADALAADGRYAEAAHHLLVRSVEDIARRRPMLVRPAITARELTVASVIPAPARTLFADIAALVERSLFGGRPVALHEWSTARAAYADFVLPQAWRG